MTEWFRDLERLGENGGKRHANPVPVEKSDKVYNVKITPFQSEIQGRFFILSFLTHDSRNSEGVAGFSQRAIGSPMISQGILGTLLGTVLGAILTFCITFFNQWRQSRKQRRIATMQVVSNLRCWMREMTWRIDQTNLWVGSGGMDGTTYNDLPNFPFETSPELISSLKPATAIRLLGLIHEKDAINIHFQWSLWAEEDVDEGHEAKLFLDVAALCKRMSLQVGWPDEVYFDRYKRMMNEQLEKITKAKTTAPVAITLDAR